MGAAAMDSWKGKSTDIEKSWGQINKAVGGIVGEALLDTLERIRQRTQNLAEWFKKAEEAGKFEPLQRVLDALGKAFVNQTKLWLNPRPMLERVSKIPSATKAATRLMRWSTAYGGWTTISRP